jgi:hypothetical protein
VAKHRLLLIFVGVALLVVCSLPFLMSASCLTRPQTLGEQKALDTLRNMTRNDVLPSEDAVAGIENQFPRTKTAALARMLRARIKLNARDFAGAATLLDSKLIAEQTSLADYALFMRGNALEQAGRTPEARAVYQQLLQEYPTSLRARDAALRVVDLLMKANDAAARPGADADTIDARAATGRELNVAAPIAEKHVSRKRHKSAAPPKPRSRKSRGARGKALPATLKPQLATLVDEVPGDEGWVYELKYDGIRLLCRVDGEDVRCISRNGLDWTH